MFNYSSTVFLFFKTAPRLMIFFQGLLLLVIIIFLLVIKINQSVPEVIYLWQAYGGLLIVGLNDIIPPIYKYFIYHVYLDALSITLCKHLHYWLIMLSVCLVFIFNISYSTPYCITSVAYQ